MISPGRGCSVVEEGEEKKYLKERCGKSFKCPNSPELYSVEPYRDDPAWNKWSPNCTLKYDNICPRDPKFYQICGHTLSKCVDVFGSHFDGVFCQSYPCLHRNVSYPYVG